jgi:hypothetical protein
MKKVVATLEGVSPYGQSRHYDTEKLPKESAKDYEKRTWKGRCHTDEDGNVFIPPMAFKNCLAECAKYLSIQIPGKGKATYTKHFEAGVMVMDPVPLGVHINDVKGLWLFVPSDGRRGGSSRVEKCFPVFNKWQVQVTFYILDETITEEVFRHHLEEAGKFIGIGFFRPRNNGYFGRFEVKNILWDK